MPSPQTQFYGKTWIYWSQSIIFGWFTIFGLIMGPLFLTGTMERGDGKPGRVAGIAITAVTVAFMLPAFIVAVFNLRVRRAPLVRIFREGVEARLIGRTRLDRIPLVPVQIRFIWGFISAEFFRVQAVRVLWRNLDDASVGGYPGMRVLSMSGAFREKPDEFHVEMDPVANVAIFQQVDFQRPLQEIADAISFYADEASRENLASWSNS